MLTVKEKFAELEKRRTCELRRLQKLNEIRDQVSCNYFNVQKFNDHQIKIVANMPRVETLNNKDRMFDLFGHESDEKFYNAWDDTIQDPVYKFLHSCTEHKENFYGLYFLKKRIENRELPSFAYNKLELISKLSLWMTKGILLNKIDNVYRQVKDYKFNKWEEKQNLEV